MMRGELVLTRPRQARVVNPRPSRGLERVRATVWGDMAGIRCGAKRGGTVSRVGVAGRAGACVVVMRGSK